MSKWVASLFLAACLCLALGAEVLAAPPMAAGDGLFVYGDYAPEYFWADNYFQLGVGYGLSENVAAGLEVMLADGETLYGAFLDLKFGSLVLDAAYQSGDGGFRIAGLWLFDLGGAQLGIGAGWFDVGEGSAEFLELAVSCPLDALSIYGTVDYYYNGGPGDLDYKIGVCYAF